MTKGLSDVLELIIVVVFIMALVFVFVGEPDLWDKWHSEALGDSCA